VLLNRKFFITLLIMIKSMHSILPIPVKRIGKLIGGEIWLDCRDNRCYVRRGTNDSLNLESIKKAFVVDAEGNKKLLNVEHDGFPLEFDEGVYAVVVEYEYGVHANAERYLIHGLAKTFLVFDDVEFKPKPLGLELEIVPEVVRRFKENDRIKIQPLFRGEPIRSEVKVRCGKKLTVCFMDDSYVEIELGKGLNVISTRYADDSKLIFSTLTIVAD